MHNRLDQPKESGEIHGVNGRQRFRYLLAQLTGMNSMSKSSSSCDVRIAFLIALKSQYNFDM